MIQIKNSAKPKPWRWNRKCNVYSCHVPAINHYGQIKKIVDWKHLKPSWGYTSIITIGDQEKKGKMEKTSKC